MNGGWRRRRGVGAGTRGRVTLIHNRIKTFYIYIYLIAGGTTGDSTAITLVHNRNKISDTNYRKLKFIPDSRRNESTANRALKKSWPT